MFLVTDCLYKISISCDRDQMNLVVPPAVWPRLLFCRQQFCPDFFCAVTCLAHTRVGQIGLSLDEWISEYFCYHRYRTNESPNIFVRKKDPEWISESIRPRANQQIFRQMNIFLQNIQIYLISNFFFPNILKNILAIFIFCVFLKTQIEPFWTKKNIFGEQSKFEYICSHRNCTNEYPNIFVSITRSQMNIRIY